MKIMTTDLSRAVMLASLTTVLFGLGACVDTPPAGAPEVDLQSGVPATPGVENQEAAAAAALVQLQLAELRRATAEFQRPEQAGAEGYTVLVAHPTSGAVCLEDSELGGMGRHLLNPDLIDDEVLVPSPEALIYEPGPNGELRLVGVEYVIPFTIRGTNEAPPVLFGREFKQNFTFDLWALHVWPWKHNPAGMFEDWNPSVSCQHDALIDS